MTPAKANFVFLSSVTSCVLLRLTRTHKPVCVLSSQVQFALLTLISWIVCFLVFVCLLMVLHVTLLWISTCWFRRRFVFCNIFAACLVTHSTNTTSVISNYNKCTRVNKMTYSINMSSFVNQLWHLDMQVAYLHCVSKKFPLVNCL